MKPRRLQRATSFSILEEVGADFGWDCLGGCSDMGGVAPGMLMPAAPGFRRGPQHRLVDARHTAHWHCASAGKREDHSGTDAVERGVGGCWRHWKAVRAACV